MMLLKKEWKLVMMPVPLLFLLLSALVLVPNYPYYVTFFYTTLGIFQVTVQPLFLIAIAVQIVLAPVRVKPHKIAVLFRIETNAVVVAVVIKGAVGSGTTVRGHSLSVGQNIAVTQSVYDIVKFSLKFIGL